MRPDDPDATEGPEAGRRSFPDEAPSGVEEELAQGARVGEYAVVRLLSGGGHGNVYVAEHRVLGRRAALKVMHRRVAGIEGMVERFVQEARIVNQVRHRNIVDIYDLGRLPDGRPYCVMELLPGRNLRALLAERGRLAPQEALALLEPVCAALSAAHAAGVVHRDVKATNVMVDDGPPQSVKLLDFGVAKVNQPGLAGLTAAGQRLGTSTSMAPEQIVGDPVDPRTDVYALGVLLHQLVTGELPYAARDPADVERMHLTAPAPRPSRVAPVPPALDAVVGRAMAKRREERFGSVAELLAALRAAAGAAAPGGEAPVPALGVYATAAPAGGGEEAFVLAAEAIASVEDALRKAGLQVVLATGEAVLAVSLLPDAPEEAAARRTRLVALARSVHDAVAGWAGPALGLRVVVHVDAVRVRQGASGPAVTGGALCEPARWAAGGPGFAVV
ncbi:MAG: serine/threonine-protein kinase [Anaeromyxobacter sp.]